VIGVASAVEDLDTYREQYDAVHERIAVLAAGDGSGLMPMLEHGADGALLAIGNVGTADWARVVESCIDGRADQVRALFADRLAPLAEVLSGDLPDRGFSGNAVIKEALVQLGFLSTSRVFGPELDLDEATKKTIAKALATAELLPPGA
jgi:dihydrodipicolinate synthase/N-acetylneuraminate lyase